MNAFTRTLASLSIVAAGTLVGACQDTEADPEPAIVTMQVAAGGNTVLVPVLSTSAQTPGPLALQANTANAFTIRFLDAAGVVDQVVAAAPDEFTLELTLPTGWTSTLGGKSGGVFTGTIRPTTTGAQLVRVRLLHEGHAEVDRNVQVNVTAVVGQ